MPYRIAHFSDFHLMNTGEDFERSLAMIDDAIDQDCNHFLITGDIVECGEMRVYVALLDEIKGRGWTRPDRLSIVPGNHDIFSMEQENDPSADSSKSNFQEACRPAPANINDEYEDGEKLRAYHPLRSAGPRNPGELFFNGFNP